MPIQRSMAKSNKILTVRNREIFSVVRDTLLDGECVSVAVRGESMLPFFRSGSTITLRPVQEGDIRKYNVVMADDYVTLFGDGNIRGMERVSREKIYGVVDCSATHLFFAKIWLWLRPVRRFPLAIFRRVM